jgi:hypothetical protein
MILQPLWVLQWTGIHELLPMSFYQRYELARLIADGETKTFRAIENATGRTVLFHFFNAEGRPVLAVLKSKWEKVPGKPQRPLLEVGDFAGTPYAVTEMIEPFTTLRQWVSEVEAGALPEPERASVPRETVQPPAIAREVARGAASDAARAITPSFDDPPRPSAPAAAGPGEFTRWFDSPPPPAASPQTDEFESLFKGSPAAGQSNRPHANAAQAKPLSQTDEFENLFDANPSPAPARPPAVNPSRPLNPPAAVNPSPVVYPSNAKPDDFEKRFGGNPAPQYSKGDPQPARQPTRQPDPTPLDEFDQLLGGPPAPAPPRSMPRAGNAKPSWPAPSAPNEETGQFTRLFGSGPSGEAINIEEEQARAARSAQPEGRPFQAPTEFTRVFGPEAGGSVSPPVPPTKIGSASRLFGSAPEAKTDPRAKPRGPGEYTRITTRAELEAEQAALDRAAAPQAPSESSSHRGLMIGLAIGGAVLVIAIIVILVIVLRKHP